MFFPPGCVILIYSLKSIPEAKSPGGGEKALRQTDKSGRTGKSARNFFFTIAQNAVAILVGLVAQRIFLRILGLEYAGLNGLFSNVITMLGIADLGIGEAVIFHLYRPLAEEDEESVLSLMQFYRRAFRVIACVIALIGISLIPALGIFTGGAPAEVNLTVIYLIFLADVVFSYFLSFKRSILYADQKNYLISTVHMAYLIGMNVMQLLMLALTRNYYAYLLSKLLCRILENLVIAAIADHLYPYLRRKDALPLKNEVLQDIRRKVGALVFHKIGTFAVNGTDNLLISAFFTLGAAGLYSSYNLVIDSAGKVFRLAISALTPSVGSLLVAGDREHIFLTFRRVRFMTFWIAAFAGTCLLVLLQPFIRLWIGEEYLLPDAVVVLLVFQFFQSLMRTAYHVFQDAAGIFYENRFVPLFESVINLVSSVILLKTFGLAGVFAGTIVSSLALWGWSFPRYIYTGLFHRRLKNYLLETLGYLGVFLLVGTVTKAASALIRSVVSLGDAGQFAADILLCLLLPNLLLCMIFAGSDCLRYFITLLKRRSL